MLTWKGRFFTLFFCRSYSDVITFWPSHMLKCFHFARIKTAPTGRLHPDFTHLYCHNETRIKISLFRQSRRPVQSLPVVSFLPIVTGNAKTRLAGRDKNERPFYKKARCLFNRLILGSAWRRIFRVFLIKTKRHSEPRKINSFGTRRLSGDGGTALPRLIYFNLPDG